MQPPMNPNQYGMQSRMHQNGMRPQQSFGIMDRRQPESRIHFMKPPVMKVKGARKCAKPSPPASKETVRPVHHQKHEMNQFAQKQPQQPEQNKNAEAMMKPAQTGYGSPVSSSASSPQQQQQQQLNASNIEI